MIKHCHANLIESRRFTDDSAVGQLAKFINQPPVANSSGLPELELTQPPLKVEEFPSLKDGVGEDHPPSKISLLNKLHALIDDYADLSFYPIADVMSATTALTTAQATSQTTSTTSKATIYQKLIDCYEKYFQQTATLFNVSEDTITAVSELSKLNELMAIFNEFQILTTGHNGDYGDEQINQVLTQAHRQFLKLPISPLKSQSQSQSQLTSQLQWFHGRPVMVRKNNYGLGLFNGDIGLCVQTKKGLAVFFEGKQQPIAVNSLGNLQVSTAYAMTVHKSQGSEFTHVAIMLDERSPRLLSREMLYTAVTRAKKQVSLFASDNSIYTAISSPTVRQTGLG